MRGTNVRNDPHPREVASTTAFGEKGNMPNAPGASTNKKLTDGEVVDLRRALSAGESIAAAARRLGRSETAVRRAARGERSYKGVEGAPELPARPATGRPPTIPASVIEAVHAARGRTASDVAREHGLSARWVRKVWAGEARLDVAAPEGAPSSEAGVEPSEGLQ
jgi:transposase-like protein